MSLFRAQALLALTMPHTGEPLIATPPGWRTAVTLATLFLLLGASTLAVLEMPRKAMASGVLVPVHGLNWVHAPVAGAVEAIHVRHGDTIRRGQALLRISHDADVSGQSFDTLDQSIDRQLQVLEERIRLVRDQRRLLRHEHHSQLDQLEASLDALRADARLETDKARIAGTTFAAARTAADRGALSRHDRDRARAAWLEGQQRLQALRAELKARESQRHTLPATQSRQLRELDDLVASITLEQRSLEQRRLELRLSRSTDIAAPVAGRIVELRPEPGAFVAAQSPQIAILPEGDHLQAELQVPSSALGFVRPGTTLRLHLESFPHAEFGAVESTVTAVAPVLQPAEPGRGFTLPTFRVLAQLDATTLRRGGQTFALQPEMRLSAFVLLERRKAWEWLFEPLLDALRR